MRPVALGLLLLAGCVGASSGRIVASDPERVVVSEPVRIWGETASGYLIGSVVAEDDRTALARATVEATAQGGRVVRAVTDSLGQFRTAVPPGRWTVRARSIGFREAASDTVGIDAGTLQRIDFELGTFALGAGR